MNEALVERARAWIAADPDVDDRTELDALLGAGDELELERRFATPLTFGTAGLRGPVMAGPSGMNRLTVRRATQGVVAWLAESGVEAARGVVVGRDARRGSEAFNDEVVHVLLGAGVAVIEMPSALPTPLVAFMVRSLGAAAGIMVTASHNPPADNGYKLYAADGAQIIPPDDEVVERHSRDASVPVLADRSSALHRYVTDDELDRYRDHMVARFAVPGGSDLRVAYTALHGVGGAFTMDLFERAGYSRVTPVAAQFTPDGAFPTLPFPNPEEPGALDLAMTCADEFGADLVVANDPDADRLGAAVRERGTWRVLRGDQIGWLLASSLIGSMTGPDDYVATTIVSSTLLERMAREAGVHFALSLTGFKWVARAAKEGVLRFGYEEALGFAVDPSVADKDGMSAALAFVRMAHDVAASGGTIAERLDEIESVYGVHAVDQLSVRVDGPGGLAAIASSVQRLREDPPSVLGGLDVTAVHDLNEGYLGLSPTDGVLLALGANGRVVVRPSGTEAKLKAYIEITPASDGTVSEQRAIAAGFVDRVRGDLARLIDL